MLDEVWPCHGNETVFRVTDMKFLPNWQVI